MYVPQSQPEEPQWRPVTPTPPQGYGPVPLPPQTFGGGQAVPVGKWLRLSLHRPKLTPILLGILVAIYLLMALSPQLNDRFLSGGQNMHILVAQGQWWRLVTATFLHAGLLHIASNGYGLYAIGMELEARIGTARFAAIYFISGLAGSVASFWFLPANVPSVGASGAIFGLIGALAVYYTLHRRLFGKVGNTWFWNMIVIIVLNMGIGFSGVLPIDNSAHLGGLFVGALLGFVLVPRYVLGDWFNLLVRNIVNTNKGSLPWLATAIIGFIVLFAFFCLLLLFRGGILHATFLQ